jgi:general secretion pathway protein M
MNRLKEMMTEGWGWYQARPDRERRLLAVAAGAVLAFVLFITFFSFSTTASSIQRRTDAKLTKLKEAELLAASYSQAQREREQVESQLGRSNISLITYVTDKAQATGLEIPTINPKPDVPVGDGKIVESAVELTLTDVSLPKLVQFLQSVERGPGVVKVTYLRIEPRPSDEVLTAWTTISTYKLNKS